MNESGAAGPHRLRLFFALWPSAAERQSLAASTAAAIAQVDGQAIPASNLHVTLAFLGMMPGRTFVHLVEIGGQGPYPTVELTFDRLEFWVKPRVLVAMPSLIPAAGLEIVDRLWGRIERLGFEREKRPWQPHLTLVRKVRRRPPEGLRISTVPAGNSDARWTLALVESTTHPSSVRYKALAEWPLAG
ncbi:MAG: RNA 2',3'-cyclic phosphodiesterase [Steroidobacteraceae bacterium]